MPKKETFTSRFEETRGGRVPQKSKIWGDVVYGWSLTECFFNLFLEISQISKNRIIIIQIGKDYWDLEICRKS